MSGSCNRAGSIWVTFARDGDTVVIPSRDRLARNLDDLRRIVQQLTGRGVRIEFVTANLAFTGDDSPLATLMLSVRGPVAEFERAPIRERPREGIALARYRGAYRGSLAVADGQAAERRRKAEAGAVKSPLARDYGISRDPLYPYSRTPD